MQGLEFENPLTLLITARERGENLMAAPSQHKMPVPTVLYVLKTHWYYSLDIVTCALGRVLACEQLNYIHR